MLLLAGVVVTLLVRHLPGNLTSVFAGKGRVTPTPACVGNDACMVRHPEGRVELTVSLIRVDVVPFTPYAQGQAQKVNALPASLRNWITLRAGSSRFLSALCFGRNHGRNHDIDRMSNAVYNMRLQC